MYSASEWICLDLWRFINVLLIINIIYIATGMCGVICRSFHSLHKLHAQVGVFHPMFEDSDGEVLAWSDSRL